MRDKKSLLDGVLYFINALFAIGLLLAYLAYYLPPDFLSLFSFAATGYPILAAVNLLFVMYWAIRLKRKILLPLIVLGLGYLHLPRTYQFGQARREVAGQGSLKVMSYNLRLLNLYQWIEDEDVPEKMATLIHRENPDVLLLQEFHTRGAIVLESLHYPYRYDNLSGHSGQVILSRYPITGSQILPLEDGQENGPTRFQWADIKWQGQTIRFMNVHLASVGLEDADYEVLENPANENQEDMAQGVKAIIGRLHRSYQRRARQIKPVQDAVDHSPYPVVLAGDFNDVPLSYMYHQLDQKLEDSFRQGGEGFGRTYIRSPLPLRIDYIFHSPALHSFNFKVVDAALSDHRPIVTELEYRTD